MFFNDPWDGKPHFNLAELEDPKRREQIALYFERVADPPLPNNQIGRVQRFELRSPGFLEGLLHEAEDKLADMINQLYRVFCLSPFPDMNSMWSQYADGHTGICIEFNRRVYPFNVALGIVYKERLPPYSVDCGEDDAATMLRTKSDESEREREYRLIARAGEVLPHNEDLGLVTHDDYLQIRPESVCSVIAGCKCDVNKLVSIIGSCSPTTKVRKAVRKPDEYRLEIVDI